MHEKVSRHNRPTTVQQLPNHRPVRTLFISRRCFPTISGMSVYAQNLLGELVRGGVDATMIAQYRGDALGRKVYGGGAPAAVPGVKVIGAESIGEVEGGDFERDVAEVVRIALEEHAAKPFDLVHAQYGYPPGLAALEISRRAGIPNLVSIQGGDGHWVGTCCAYHRAAMQAVLNHSGAVLIGSKSFAEEVVEANGTAMERFTFIPGAVATARFTPRTDWRAGGWNDAQRPRLLYHGRVDRRKGALDLVGAFAALLRRPDLRARPELLISGIGPDSDAVESAMAQHGLQADVRILGYVAYDDVPEVYRQADIFLSPTYAEGFSNTILEAMASGLPCISTYSVGVVDCLRDGDNGLLVTPGDVAALEGAMHRMLTDDALRAQIAVRALSEVRRVYSWGIVGRMIVDVYESLIGTAPDNDWSLPAPDPACRYRKDPHLL